MQNAAIEALGAFQHRMHRWPEVEALTVGQFRTWLDAEIARNDAYLVAVPEREDRDLVKEAQMDGVALAGAAVALRLFMEAMLS